MSSLVFFEKPGCMGNANQKRLLRSEGIELTVRDLLSECWTAETLRPFFEGLAVSDWFNLSSPRIKSGEVRLGEVDESAALALMMQDPLLIRRPLMQFGELRQAGFVRGPVLDALGVFVQGSEDFQSCAMGDESSVCGGAA